MLKRFTTKQLVLLALIAAFIFVFDMAFVSGIEAVVGVPGVGVLVDTIFVLAIATIGGLIVRKPGTFTIIILIYSTLCIPTNIIGPPGAYKLLIGLFLGLFADIVLALFHYRRLGYLISLPIANVLVFPLLLYMMIVLALPGAQELQNTIWMFIGITAI